MLKVLVAEDDVIVADMLGDFLSAEGYDVCGIAGTVGEAVRLGDLHKPDIGVFDFRLAGGEFGSDIRPRLQDKDGIGILFVSGDALYEKMTRADGVAYIQKPYAMNDLMKALLIVQKVRTNSDTADSTFPKSFQLLKDLIDDTEGSA